MSSKPADFPELKPRISVSPPKPRFILPFGPKAHNFAFRPPEQDSFLTLLEGSVRSAKTWSMLPKLVQLLRYDVGGLKVIVGQSKQSIYNNILNDLFTLIGKGNYTYNIQSGVLRMFGDEWVVIGARDEGSEKAIRGSTIGVAYVDELVLTPKSFFMMLLSRMSPEGARGYFTTNPDNPFHYVKTDLIDNPNYKDMLQVISFQLNDNPNITQQYKDNLRKMYKGVFHKRFVLGEWVMAEGSIYGSCYSDDDWTQGGNTFDEITKPIGLYNDGGYQRRFISVDYGTTNPMVFGEILDDGTKCWQIGEYYWNSKTELRQKTDSEYADDMLAFIEASPVKRRDNICIIVDPSAASFKLELRSRGLYVIDADNTVNEDDCEGIPLVAVMLGSRRYLIHQNCPKTRLEIPNYSWDDKAALRGLERPLKQNDHCCDMVRYFMNTHIHQWRAVSA